MSFWTSSVTKALPWVCSITKKSSPSITVQCALQPEGRKIAFCFVFSSNNSSTAVITSSLNLKGWKLVPVILAPALGALSRGLLFGPMTIYLIYLLPFIWIGNTILVFTFKQLKLNNKLKERIKLKV